MRFHDLRHTRGSQWIQDGVILTKVSRWLGHHSVAFTADVYVHLADEPDYDNDVEKINRAIAARAATAG